MAQRLCGGFAGIRPADVLPFVIAECIGGTVATALFAWLSPVRHVATDDLRRERPVPAAS